MWVLEQVYPGKAVYGKYFCREVLQNAERACKRKGDWIDLLLGGFELLTSLSKPKDDNSILRSCCRFLWPLYLLISCNLKVRVGT